MNAPVLKTGVGDEPTVGSNPTLPATIGEMAERLKAHAWNACKGEQPFVGSNPTLSARGVEHSEETALLNALLRPVRRGWRTMLQGGNAAEHPPSPGAAGIWAESML